MFVCGGFRTCVRVCCGVVKFVRRRCSDFGRHFENAPRFARKNPPPPPPPPNPPPPPLFEPRPPPFWPVLLPPLPVEPPLCCCSFWKQACIAWNCAAVGRGMLRVIENVFPPVFSFATIFGTTPS